MPRKITPKENVEYIFRFTNKNLQTHVTKLIYISTLPNGRLEFFNKSTKTYTTMAYDRFRYIHRFNLLEERPVKTVLKAPSKIHIDDKPLISDEEMAQNERRSLEILQNLTPIQERSARVVLGRPVSDFVNDLKEVFTSQVEQAFLNKTMSEYLKVCNLFNIKV